LRWVKQHGELQGSRKNRRGQRGGTWSAKQISLRRRLDHGRRRVQADPQRIKVLRKRLPRIAAPLQPAGLCRRPAVDSVADERAFQPGINAIALTYDYALKPEYAR
jgi:hypothetical protein